MPRQNVSETTKRVPVRLPNKVNAWFDEKSRETGIAKSSLISLAAQQYMEQQQNVNEVPELLRLFKEFKEYKDNKK